MSTCGRPSLRPARQHLGQAVQRLRAEDEVDVRRALDDRRAFLAGDAAADADQRAARLQVLDAAEVAEHLLLRLLAHRAGVEEDQVGVVDVVGRLVAGGGVQHVGHLGRVVDVHLAAEGLDEDPRLRRPRAAHGLIQTCATGSKIQACASAGVVGHGLHGGFFGSQDPDVLDQARGVDACS